MREYVVILNELAQALRPMSWGVSWFEELASEEQFAVLRDLAAFSTQAGATAEDGPESVFLAGIRPTHTPAVLITRGRLPEQLAKIINLPLGERVKAFRLLIALLAVADQRRRERYCKDGCSHTWHQLGDQRIWKQPPPDHHGTA
ncbi:hypothetical protein GCM10023194_29070 [Planotetraspora phitsanulokensis]|uniref:Uncharacterized protein n=1 Tax=Planotetraspora phitsanulokensis TaxID=575192 RepID=A0A8J3UBE2_9ACTN|nr:DUF5958 family protein [Planotetraspora phitsanulokensis]GII35955.1 hypothetical protein Pph01_09580 [Planotetraspora phitsanulokensis]